MENQTETVESLIAYCQQNKRICPLPIYWDKLFKMLPNKRSVGAGWEPAAPLILAAWHIPAMFKQLRVIEHIEWANNHGCLEQVATFLRGLKEEEWYHLGD